MGRQELADRVAMARAKTGLKQRQVAEIAGLSAAYIARLEGPNNVIRNPRRETLERVAAALGVRAEWLLTGRRPRRAA